jgi:hypothetical protein
MSQMSDVLSVDSGPESEYDFNDLNNVDVGNSASGGTPIRKKLGNKLSRPAPVTLLASIQRN